MHSHEPYENSWRQQRFLLIVTEHVNWYVANRVHNSQNLTPHIYSELKRKTYSGSRDRQDLVVKCPLRLVVRMLNISR